MDSRILTIVLFLYTAESKDLILKFLKNNLQIIPTEYIMILEKSSFIFFVFLTTYVILDFFPWKLLVITSILVIWKLFPCGKYFKTERFLYILLILCHTYL